MYGTFWTACWIDVVVPENLDFLGLTAIFLVSEFFGFLWFIMCSHLKLAWETQVVWILTSLCSGAITQHSAAGTGSFQACGKGDLNFRYFAQRG